METGKRVHFDNLKKNFNFILAKNGESQWIEDEAEV
jgi:hypothetical protein